MQDKDNGRVPTQIDPRSWPSVNSEGHEHDYGGEHRPALVRRVVSELLKLRRRRERKKKHKRRKGKR